MKRALVAPLLLLAACGPGTEGLSPVGIADASDPTVGQGKDVFSRGAAGGAS